MMSVTSITEADVFRSSHPQLLLKKYFPDWDQRRRHFGIREDLDVLENIWQKFRRIDLVQWDPVDEGLLFDYSSQKYKSLSELEMNLQEYTFLSLERLRKQFEKSLPRWTSSEYQNQQSVVERIQRLVSTIRQREEHLKNSKYLSVS